MEELDIQKQIDVLLNQAVDLLNNKKDYAKAIATLKKLERIDAQNPVVLYNLAITYIHCKEFGFAIDYLMKCMSLPMTFIDIHHVRKLHIFCLLQLGQFKEVLDECKGWENLDEVIIQMKAYALEKTGNLREALDLYEAIIKNNKDNINACNAIAYIEALLPDGNLNKALGLAKKAVAHNPDSAAYCDTLGYVYFKMRQYDLAKKFLKKALSLQPDNSEIRTHIDELLNIP